MSDPLRPHGLQHTGLPCPSPSPGVSSNPCPLSRWCHPTTSHPLSPHCPPALNLSKHQGLFQWVGSSYQMAKLLKLQFSISPSNEYSGLISFRIDWFDLLLSRLSRVFSSTTIQKHQLFSFSLHYGPVHTSVYYCWKKQLWLDGPVLAKWCLCFLIHCLSLSQLFFKGTSDF